jgi:invasion protein IalB
MRVSKWAAVAGVLGVIFVGQLVPGAVRAQPSFTTATYGAWIVRCQRQKDGGAICEMVQTLTSDKDHTAVVAQVAIGQLPNTKTLRAVLQVPLGVDLTKAPSLTIGEKAQYSGRYMACDERFCRAEIDLPTNVAEEMGKAKKASLNFTLKGKNFVVTMTTDGMAVAFDRALKGTV